MLNHHPSQIGIWFTYNGWRYKDVYHLRLHSGEELRCMYPNGNSWYPEPNSDTDRCVTDDEVAALMLAPDADVYKYRYVGEERIKINLDTFAGYIPELKEQTP